LPIWFEAIISNVFDSLICICREPEGSTVIGSASIPLRITESAFSQFQEITALLPTGISVLSAEILAFGSGMRARTVKESVFSSARFEPTI
jgi:hypothetical protein